MDSASAIALGGFLIAGVSLVVSVLVFGSGVRRTAVDDMRQTIRDLQAAVQQCKAERAADMAQHAREMDTMRSQHRADIEALRADLNWWREMALRHGLGRDEAGREM